MNVMFNLQSDMFHVIYLSFLIEKQSLLGEDFMDRISKSKRSWNMSQIKSSDTKLELLVRRYLFSKGLRYRLHSTLKGKPDLVFPKEKIAVFVNGCFWHMHNCKLSSFPSSRKEYWELKLERNRARDNEVLQFLNEQGWRTIQLWECKIKEGIEKATLDLINMISKTKVP